MQLGRIIAEKFDDLTLFTRTSLGFPFFDARAGRGGTESRVATKENKSGAGEVRAAYSLGQLAEGWYGR